MILAIDTSSAISAALVDDEGNEALAARSEFSPRGHAERLAELIHEVLDEAGAGFAADAGPASRPPAARIGRIVVGTGPGPFTGLRVGLVTARMLGLAWGVPVEGVCSLDALGAQHGDVTAVGDARRKEVYWARYEAGVRVSGPTVSSPLDVPADGAFVGRGAALYPDHFPGAVAVDPQPVFLVRVALAAQASERPLPSEPLYLRRPDVHGQTAAHGEASAAGAADSLASAP